MSDALARFISAPQVKRRHATLVRAPADLVFHVAETFDLESIWLVHALFWARAKILGAKAPPPRRMKGLVEELTSIGWRVLARDPGRLLVAGAATRPWEADVTFTPIPPEDFASFAGPDQVKIVWTLEAEPLGPASTRFATETRVEPTDEGARRKFRRYWRTFGGGIVLIRWVLLPAVRREAERRWTASNAARPVGR